MKKLIDLIQEILYTFDPVWNDEYTKVGRTWAVIKKKKRPFKDCDDYVEVKDVRSLIDYE